MNRHRPIARLRTWFNALRRAAPLDIALRERCNTIRENLARLAAGDRRPAMIAITIKIE